MSQHGIGCAHVHTYLGDNCPGVKDHAPMWRDSEDRDRGTPPDHCLCEEDMSHVDEQRRKMYRSSAAPAAAWASSQGPPASRQ